MPSTKTDFFRSEEFIPYAPTSPGTIHKHHCKSGVGNDKLYITRKDNGDILAFCHHCGMRGYHSKIDKRLFSPKKSIAYPTTSDSRTDFDIYLPRDSSKDFSKKGRGELRSWGICMEDALQHGIRESKVEGRLIIPIYNEGVLTAWQGRDLLKDPDLKRPKWLTRKKKYANIYYEVHTFPSTPSLCIVEDIPSAIRVGKYINCLALLGTELNIKHKEIITKYNSFYLWMDHDNPTVIKKEANIIKFLNIFGSVSHIITDQDPKNYTDSEIQKWLY